MTCKYYGGDDQCNLPTGAYCLQMNEYGFCRTHGAIDRDDPV